MLLFSTILDIKETLTPEDFYQLVIDWNQSSPHPENVIPGIEWNGEKHVRYATENLSLEIMEYRNEGIVAARYEKHAQDGVIWGTDYVMNFLEMRMSIRLDRSFLAEALTVDPKFSTPFFITQLVRQDLLKDDHGLPVVPTPIMIGAEEAGILSALTRGETVYDHPVVYVSRDASGNLPLDVELMANRLKGVAHVLVQREAADAEALHTACEGRDEYNGAVGIYYPTQALGHQKFLNHPMEAGDEKMLEKVVRAVIEYANVQRTDMLYTWQGVMNALLRDRYTKKREELQQAETAMERSQAETEELLQGADDELEKLHQQIAALSRQNDALLYENQGLRASMARRDAQPILYLGSEDELYTDEIKDMLLCILQDRLDNTESHTRRADVLGDVIRANGGAKYLAEERATKIKGAMSGYKTINGALRRTLQELGFEITSDKSHIKLTYCGDGRYIYVMPCTPGDVRSGMNCATQMIRMMF